MSLTTLLADLPSVTYGQPLPSPDYPARLASALGLPFPFALRVVQHRHLPAPPPPPEVIAWPVHAGLTAWAWAAEAPPPATGDWLTGDPCTCPTPARTLVTLQNGIVAMRRRELADVRRRHQAYLGPADEQRLVSLTVRTLRDTDDGALALARTCTELLLLRHENSLNTVRRKLLELVTAVTRDTDAAGHFPADFLAAATRVLQGFLLSEFLDWFPPLLVELAGAARAIRLRDATGRYSPLVAEAVHYIRHRHAAPVSLRDVAAALRVSPAHLARRFHTDTGTTVVAMLNQLRVAAAADRLTTGDEPLKQIAGLCGFASLEHFQRTFKRLTGHAPGHYRGQATHATAGGGSASARG